MSKFDRWMRIGVTWEEVMKDLHQLRPEETQFRYKIIGGDEEDPEIEKHERSTEGGSDTMSITKDDLIDEGLLLEIDPVIYECVEIQGDYYFFVGTEEITVGNRPREAYRFIRKFRTECERCGGTGECPDCGATGECEECGQSGKCQDCDGSRTCVDCDGEGMCYTCEGRGRCQNCEGTGRVGIGPDAGPCSECNGTGNCEACGGSGLCGSCKGSKRCATCSGTGKCAYCNGSARCAYCNGSVKCIDCKGTGNPMMVYQSWYDVETGLLLLGLVNSDKRTLVERAITSMNLSGGHARRR
jgi:hypothetical protein